MDPVLHEWQWVALWPYAILIIIAASWGLYRFLAPASWHDWAAAGLVQAFIIALYSEMYGFPLTIYVLTSFLPIHIPMVHSSGHLWATLLGYGREGDAVEMAIGTLFIAAGLVLIAKGWVRVYFSCEDLCTDGIYGLVRHPQYAGIFLAILGQFVHWPTLPTLVLSPLIGLAYFRLARREEARLISRFGTGYLDYRQRVPMFIPRWQSIRQGFAAL